MNDKMNKNLYEANVKMVDENKLLKNDIEYLHSKIDNVISHLKESLKETNEKELKKYIKNAIENLEETN